jgi:hypothetical protein
MKGGEMGEKCSKHTCERYQKCIHIVGLKMSRKETIWRPAGSGGIILSIF